MNIKILTKWLLEIRNETELVSKKQIEFKLEEIIAALESYNGKIEEWKS